MTNNNDKVFSFLRREKERVVVVVNLSGETQQTVINISEIDPSVRNIVQLFGNEKAEISERKLKITLPSLATKTTQPGVA